MSKASEDRVVALKARARDGVLRGFYIHLGVFVAVMSGLCLLDYADGGRWWVQWPFIGWGLGILGHAYLVFYAPDNASSALEKHEIKVVEKKL